MQEIYKDKPKKSSGGIIALNVALTVIIAILLVIIIIFTTTLTTITVSGNSMLPTLADGDKLILLKRGYQLNRGDIIVFKRENSANVKRILGVEGDIIQFDWNNEVWVVNGKPYVEDYVTEGYSGNYFTSSYYEVLEAIFSDEGYEVPQGQIFVLGDNRNIHDGGYSVDSHIYGALDIANIIGKVIKIY